MSIDCYRSVAVTMIAVSAMTSVLACRAHRSSPVAPVASSANEGPRISQAPSLWVHTDDSIYSFRRRQEHVELDIGISYTNRDSVPLYASSCPRPLSPPVLWRREGDRWVYAYTPAVGDICQPPVLIDPGKTYHYVERVHAYLPSQNVSPEFRASPAGTYRFEFRDVFETRAPSDSVPRRGPRLPEDARISNEFRIVER